MLSHRTKPSLLIISRSGIMLSELSTYVHSKDQVKEASLQCSISTIIYENPLKFSGNISVTSFLRWIFAINFCISGSISERL